MKELNLFIRSSAMTKIPTQVTEGSANVIERLLALGRSERHAVLATTTGGVPHTSLISYSLTPDLSGLLFATPIKTTKYKNIVKNRRVSVLIDARSNTSSGYVNAEAIRISGIASALRKGSRRDELARGFLLRHPALAGFLNDPGVAFMLVEIKECTHVDKFQSVTHWTVQRKRKK
jgi:heme iron utilization protein